MIILIKTLQIALSVVCVGLATWFGIEGSGLLDFLKLCLTMAGVILLIVALDLLKDQVEGEK